jgi:hypothetical protein
MTVQEPRHFSAALYFRGLNDSLTYARKNRPRDFERGIIGGEQYTRLKKINI